VNTWMELAAVIRPSLRARPNSAGLCDGVRLLPRAGGLAPGLAAQFGPSMSTYVVLAALGGRPVQIEIDLLRDAVAVIPLAEGDRASRATCRARGG
jgi:hypothetical protein